MSVLAVWREPFGFTPHVQHLPEGLSLAGMAARMRGLPAPFDGTICVNGTPIPPALWGMVKPRPVAAGVPVEVTFHLPLRDGGDGGGDGKSAFALIAAIGLTLATGFIGGGGLSFLGASFQAGRMGAQLAAAGTALLGSLLLNALVPPPSLDDMSARDSRRDASARGNVLEPNGPVPRVVGERKVFPPLLAEPLVTYDGQDEVVEAVFGLSGPHRLTDIRVGDAPAGDIVGLQVQTREGWPGDKPLNLVRRYGRTEAVQSELRGHQVDPDNGARLDRDIDASLAVPQPMLLMTRPAPDEHQLQMAFLQGLYRQASDGDRLRVPLRIRLRLAGSSAWRNLPELHFEGAETRQRRAVVRLVWGGNTRLPRVGADAGFVAAFTDVPGQDVSPETDGWQADAYFYDGAGDTYIWRNNFGTTGLRHVLADRHECAIWLDPADWPKGRYEVEVMRGCAVRGATWSNANYTTGGALRDLFAYVGSDRLVPYSRAGVTDTLALVRSVSVWHAPPVATDEFALIAMRARNRALERVSVVAGGYVRDWDGSGWHDWAVTDNPAPHLRDIFAGRLNADPVPEAVIDNDELVAWRADCVASGYKVNALMDSVTVAEAALVVAANGFARPYMSEVWGVVRDYDRSADAPVQVFTPRNSANFSWSRAFPALPDGFRVNFSDAAEDYAARQITVLRPGATDRGRTEQVTYEGVTTEAEARRRALYDLRQLEARGTFYKIDVPPEAIICRRGSLVGLVHDSLLRQSAAARVLEGGTTSVVLDTIVPTVLEPHVDDVADFDAVANVDDLGVVTAAVVRRSDGSVATHALANATGESDVLTFASAVDPVAAGDLVAVGPLHREQRRLIVLAIEPRDEFEASMTLVDEAAELFA